MSRPLQSLIEEQIGRWEELQRTRQPAPSGVCVALSHLPGAGGRELAESVAKRLGFGLFDREIVEAIASDAGTRAQLVADLDEHVRTGIDRYFVDLLRGRQFTESDYLKGVARVVGTLARRGRAVVLGRGSTAILAPHEALRVLVVAPREARVARVAKERGLDEAAAGERLDREEANRAEFFRHHFHRRQEDPALYDLAINTATWSLDSATTLVAEAFARHASERIAAGTRSQAG